MQGGHIWAHQFAVPLFFFLSGVAENFNQRSLAESVQNTAVSLLLPWVFFSLLCTLFLFIFEGSVPWRECLSVFLQGNIRNQSQFAALWFFTGLFSVKIIFSIIKKLKVKWLIFAVCLMLWWGAESLLPVSAVREPRWWYNIDSACYYILYFCLGWISFGNLRLLLESYDKGIQLLKAVLFLVCGMYSIQFFWERDMLLSVWTGGGIFAGIRGVVGSLISVLFIVILSSYLSVCEGLRAVGRNSVYLCGSDYIVRNGLMLLPGIFGVEIVLTSPVQAWMLAVLFCAVVHKCLVPWEKILLRRIQMAFVKKEERLSSP